MTALLEDIKGRVTSRGPHPDVEPRDVAYRLGTAIEPPGGHELWSRLDQSMRVIGPPGSGKTQRVFAPLLRDAPGPGIGSTTKPDLAELTWKARRRVGPVCALDPYGLLPGLPRMRWNPITGCESTHTAELRGQAFAAGAQARGTQQSEAGKFYRESAGNILMCALHAAACEGATLRTWIGWCRDLLNTEVRAILTRYEDNFGAVDWGKTWDAYTTGDPRTVGNTRATVDGALAAFRHESILELCAYPGGFDVESFLDASGTLYLLGKEKQNSSISPLFTAIVEDVLDRAEEHAYTKPTSRLTPPLMAALDEIALLTPIPSLPQRVGDGRGRGLCTIYGAQAWSQIVSRYGEDDAKSLSNMTNNLLVFGGCKDPEFLRELEELSGKVRGRRASFSSRVTAVLNIASGVSEEVQPAMWAHEIQQLEEGAAYLLADSSKPIKVHVPALYEDAELQAQIDTEKAELVELCAGRKSWALA